MIGSTRLHGSCRPVPRRISWPRRIPTSAAAGADVFSLAPPSKHLDAAAPRPNSAAKLGRSSKIKKSIRGEGANVHHSSICNAAAPVYWRGWHEHCCADGTEYTMTARRLLSATTFPPSADGARSGGQAGCGADRAGARPPRAAAVIGQQGDAGAFGQSRIRADGRCGWDANTFKTRAGPQLRSRAGTQRVLCTRRRGRLISLKAGA